VARSRDECFICLTAALVMLALIYAVVGLIVGVAIPLGEIYYEMNIEQHPQMCGVPGEYRQCEVMP
jgi:fumarate reductase subunit D